MCGICGVIGPDLGGVLPSMLQRLIHRGPDEEGTFRRPGIALGARRLRVIDPEFGQQPVRNEAGTVWAVMNGEIYNYRELREQLSRRGHRFITQGDTEVLVHLYEDDGFNGFHRLRGMFAFALWDHECRTAWLVRDRLGIKPLYYALRQQEEITDVLFASELPALIEALPEWRIRPEAIIDYLTHLYIPGPETIIAGVHHLQPGEALKVADGRLDRFHYYQLKAEVGVQHPWSGQEAYEEVLRVLRETVNAHLISDAPLGLFLSGGLDSASLLALMSEQASPVKTFSIGYEHPADQSFSELESARLLAAHFGAVHTEAILNPDVESLLEDVVSGMGEPFADASAIPTYLVSEVAKRTVTVALSGIGGDELFGGYPRYLGLRTAQYYQCLPEVVRAHLGQWSTHLVEPGTGRDYQSRIKRFFRDGDRALHEQYRRWTTALPVEWEATLWGECLEASATDKSSSATTARLFDTWPSSDPCDRAMGIDLQRYLPDDLLRMADRMSMVHSLELRVPFCDHRLLSAALRITSGMRFAGWQLKGFMRRMLRGLLPERILRAPKQGFMVPIARWFRDDLHGMVRDLLSDEAIKRRGYIKPAYVHWLLEEHQTGRRNCSDQLYALMVLELWHQGLANHAQLRRAVGVIA